MVENSLDSADFVDINKEAAQTFLLEIQARINQLSGVPLNGLVLIQMRQYANRFLKSLQSQGLLLGEDVDIRATGYKRKDTLELVLKTDFLISVRNEALMEAKKRSEIAH